MSLRGFNLIQDATAPPDAWDNVYNWVSKVGRIVVMVVELVVVVSFVTRIVIDTQAKDLQKQEQSLLQILTASQVNEFRFRDYQQRFNTYRSLWNSSSTYLPAISQLAKLAPSNITDLAISLRDKTITFRGKSPINQVNSLETALKSSDQFTSVLVPEISTDTQTKTGSVNVDFSIRMELKPEVYLNREKIQSTQ